MIKGKGYPALPLNFLSKFNDPSFLSPFPKKICACGGEKVFFNVKVLVFMLALTKISNRVLFIGLKALLSFFIASYPLFSVVPAAQAEGLSAEAASSFKEAAELIAEIPENSLVVGDSVRPVPDIGKIVYVRESENGFRVCMNNECGPIVDRVARGMPAVSPNGEYVAAVVQSGGDARVMLGGGLSAAYDMVYGLRFSPDSMILAYIARKDDAFSVYANQDRHRAFVMVDPNQGLIFSRDSKNLAYVASSDGQSWQLVKNGEPGEAFEQIKHVTFSPDSSRLVYAARKDGKWHLVEGQDKGSAYIDIKRILFSPDSERLVYAARDDEGAFMVLDGEKSEPFEYLPGEPVFSRDGKRLAYAVAEERRGNVRMRMVVDGKAGPAFHRIGAYRFSPDGKQIAYMAVKDDETGMMVHDGEVGDEYRQIGIPIFSPDGSHLAYYAVQDGQWFVVKDGEKGPPFVVGENPVFCPKGERMAYVAQKGDRYVVVEDNEIIGHYDWAGLLAFSPDGKHLAYAAAEDGEAFLVVDGQKAEERFLSFVRGSPLVFTEENAVQGIAVRAFADGRQEFWLVRAQIDQ